MSTDYDEQLGYDADHDDPSQYCKHGTFIGSWWGPDYLCQWCEEGVSVEDMHRIQREQALDEAQRRIDEFDRIIVIFNDLRPRYGWNPAVAAALFDIAEEPRYQQAWATLQAA